MIIYIELGLKKKVTFNFYNKLKMKIKEIISLIEY